MPDPSSYPDLDALLAGAKASLARANNLAKIIPPDVHSSAPVAPAAPAPVDDSLWGRIKAVGNFSGLPGDVGDQFVNGVGGVGGVDMQAERDSKAARGEYSTLDTVKSAAANSLGNFLDMLRGQATPVGIGTLASGGEGTLAKVLGGAGSLVFGGQGLERAADPTAGTASRVTGAFDALQGALGLHGIVSDLPAPGSRSTTPPLKVERYAPNLSAAPHEPAVGVGADAIPPPSVADWTPRQMAGAGDMDLPLSGESTPAPPAPVQESAPFSNVEQPAPAEQPAASSPLANLLRPRVSAAEAADNLASSGSLLGSSHASDEAAGMERDFGGSLPEVLQQLKARRNVEHLEAARNNARYDYLTAPDATPDTPSAPPGREGHFTLPQPRAMLDDQQFASAERRINGSTRPDGLPDRRGAIDPARAAQIRQEMDDLAAANDAARSETPGVAAPAAPDVPPTPPPPPSGTSGGKEAGFGSAGLLSALLRPAVGAGLGAYFDSDNRTQGALLGAGLGGATLVPSLAAKLERLRYASMLSGTAPIKKLISDTGVAVNTAAERALTHGPAAGGSVLKEFFNPATVKDFANRVRTNGADPSILMDQPTSTSYSGLLGLPPRLMGSATEATQAALGRAGISPEDALRRTFTAEPQTTLGQKVLGIQRSEPGARLVLPFAKTAINMLESGTLPIRDLLTRMGSLDPGAQRQVLAKVGLLGASGAAGAGLGSTDWAQEHPSLAKLATLLSGPGALEASAGQAFAHALHEGKSSNQALTSLQGEVRQSLPMPSEWATSSQELLASLVPSSPNQAYNYLTGTDTSDVDTKNNVFAALLKRIPGLASTLPTKGSGRASKPRLLGDDD